MVGLSKIMSTNELSGINVTNELFIGGEILAGLCVAAGIITLIYQRKKNKLVKTIDEKCLDDYSYRDLFHFFINPEYHWDKMNLAKEFSDRMHAKAAEYMMCDHEDNPDFPDHFTYIKYDQKKVNEKLDYIFQRLFKEKYLDWCESGQPVSSDSRYWWAQTKVHLTTYLIQRSPFHLTDGIWLRGVPQGPMSPIQAKLFAIYIDELGNGDINQNHCNVYLDVLKSLGLHVPQITSREFVDQKSILEISFQKPLLTLTTSLFPQSFTPEILGYTLWLETTSPTEHAGLRKILDRYNLNPKFSLLHTAIDNNVNGHGRYAREAVEEYLKIIQETQGDKALQEHWKRIWIGYVAYGITGDNEKEMKQLFEEQRIKTPREEFIQLIKKKSSAAKVMHGSRRVGPNQYLLNQLFAQGDAETICDELQNSDMIVMGNPGKSKLLNHAISFNGPMYQIFNADEISIITRWILSLAPSTVNDVISLILKRRKLSQNIQSDLQLKLPDGSNKSLKHLFQGQPQQLLAAFRASQWTIPHNGAKLTEENVQTSELIQSMNEGGILEKVFLKNEDDEQILRKWLLDGATLPDETFEQSNEEKQHFQINSHQNFKFQY